MRRTIALIAMILLISVILCSLYLLGQGLSSPTLGHRSPESCLNPHILRQIDRLPG